MDQENYKIQFGKCCNPIPGDEVIGYKNPNEDVVLIHKAKCPTAMGDVRAAADALETLVDADVWLNYQ